MEAAMTRHKHRIGLGVLALALGGLMWLLLAQPAATQAMAALQEPAGSVEEAPPSAGVNDGTGPATGVVEGVVMEQWGGPVAGAVVRWRTTTNHTTTALDGSFVLTGLPTGTVTTITAWQEGYLIGGATVTPPQTGAIIEVLRHYTVDNAGYTWFSSNDPAGPLSCVHCMVAHPQWRANAHGNSATNPRFFSLYNGTYLTTTAVVSPGFKLDYPGEAGYCAACHAPIAAIYGITTPVTLATTITQTFTADMNDLSGVETEGSSCEFCHKVGEVYLDPVTGLPYDNAPGVFSMRLYRSPPGGILWFGPFDDVWRRVTYLELEKTSQFCAPCHQFSFQGTPIYESFREWLDSPYPDLGIECQTCHMAPTGVDHFAKPEEGGLTRHPDLIASHLQPGASDVTLLQNTVDMSLSARQVAGSLQVTVAITNTEAGHHVPTDHPGRHLILVVSATGDQGGPLVQREGPTVPAWGGDQAGLPGKAFAKVLRDEQTGESPVVSYWKPVSIASDNRIPALAGDTSTYTFALPTTGGPVTVDAELRFRRLFQPLMDDKGWSTPDVIMEERHIELTTEPAYRLFLPLIVKG
jgi:hypothetical protein